MTAIEWCRNADGSPGKSWNPIRARHKKTGRLGHYCEHVSEACRFCYAERLNLNARNLPFGGTGLAYKPGLLGEVEILLDEKRLRAPLAWRKAQRVFVCSMDDPFGHWVSDAMRDSMMAVAALCPQHQFIWLTKRAREMRTYFCAPGLHNRIAWDLIAGIMTEPKDGAHRSRAIGPCTRWPLPNVWGLVSCGDQADADALLPELLATPLARRGVSCEPLLGPIDLRPWRPPPGAPAGAPPSPASGGGTKKGLDWVIAGGESGARDQAVRPMHPAWLRSLHDQCDAAKVKFFFKQWGEWQDGSDFANDDSVKAVLTDGRVLDPDEASLREADRTNPVAPCLPTLMRRVGKRRAGRLLDGIEHNAWPEVAA